jgi:hypothetical protein
MTVMSGISLLDISTTTKTGRPTLLYRIETAQTVIEARERPVAFEMLCCRQGVRGACHVCLKYSIRVLPCVNVIKRHGRRGSALSSQSSRSRRNPASELTHHGGNVTQPELRARRPHGSQEGSRQRPRPGQARIARRLCNSMACSGDARYPAAHFLRTREWEDTFVSPKSIQEARCPNNTR